MPLPAAVQARMETSFAADFSTVRVHEGTRAEAMGALAYTQGADIHFAPGQYDPASLRGQELLGHELAHVVQQSQGRVSAPGLAKGLPVNDDPSLEREAEAMGARAARGQQAHGADAQAVGPAVGLAAPGRESALPVQRLKKDQQEIDISKLDYNTAYSYLIMLREKAVDNKAHPQLEVAQGDMAALEQRIGTLEPDQAVVICPEGQAKRATKDQQISFGAVTSCLTFTCILEGGGKIVAHEAVKNRVPNGAVQAINALKANDTIEKVIIVGVAGSWQWKDGVLSPVVDDRTNIIASDTEGFASEFATAIGAAEGEFKSHAAGDVVMDAKGAYVNPFGAAEAALQEHLGVLMDEGVYTTTRQAAIDYVANKVYGGDKVKAEAALDGLLENNPSYETSVQ